MIPFTAMSILNTIKEFFGGQGYYGQAKDPRLFINNNWKVTPFFLLEGVGQRIRIKVLWNTQIMHTQIQEIKFISLPSLFNSYYKFPGCVL